MEIFSANLWVCRVLSNYVNFIVFNFIYFSDVLRANEFSTSVGVVTTTHTEYNLETSDFFRVYCESENGQHR